MKISAEKKVKVILLLIFIIVLTLTNSTYAYNDNAQKEGRIIVQFIQDTGEVQKEKIKNEVAAIHSYGLNDKGLELIKIKDGKNIGKTIEKLSKNKNVVFAEEDYFIEKKIIPNDEYFSLLWGMNNGNDIDINAPEAWDTTMGYSNVIVAVIDDGIYIQHPDLETNIWINTEEIPANGIDDDGNGLTDDVNGWDFYNNDSSIYDSFDNDYHGTHVAGTIAATGNNGIGVIGVSPNIRIMPLKFLGPDGGYTSDAILAIQYAQAKGAKVINASWGYVTNRPSVALKNAIDAYDGVFVAAAGNDGSMTDRKVAHYPSSYDLPNIISVAAVDSAGKLASFSNYGVISVDLGAPGVDILSTYPGTGYVKMSGTSMASPHVAGAAALMISQQTTFNQGDVVSGILSSVKSLPSLDGKVKTGGMLDIHAMLNGTTEPPDPEPDPNDTVSPYVTGTVPRDGSKNVPVSKDITVNFNENIILNDAAKILINGTPAMESNESVNLNVLTISVDKTALTTYTVELGEGTVIDSAGNLSEGYIFSFITGKK